jgi:hypothetical protein
MVTMVTSADTPVAGLEASRTADSMRERLHKHGVEILVVTALLSWEGNTARLINLYTGDEEEREFDSLVLASTNTSENHLTRALADSGKEVHSIGDSVSARTAAMAFYEARRLALTL